MKFLKTIRTHVGTDARLYRTVDGTTGKVTIEIVAGDLWTNRSPTFLTLTMQNNAQVWRHVRKIEVDGLKQGHKPGYVISEEGIPELAEVLQRVSARTQANKDTTTALCTWFTNILLPEMKRLREEIVPAEVAPARPFSGRVYVTLGSVKLEADLGRNDTSRETITLQTGGSGVTYTLQELCAVVGLPK